MADKPDYREQMAEAFWLTSVVHGRQRDAMEALVEIYGDDANTILNALHEMAVRVAFASGVSPDDFAAGVKHHWDFLANAFNGDVEERAGQS